MKSQTLKQVPKTQPKPDQKTCKFCSETDQDALEQHHIVPKRHGGSNKQENLVDLCASCHRKLESLYDKRFYQKVSEKEFECPYCGKQHDNHQIHKEHVMTCFEGV